MKKIIKVIKVTCVQNRVYCLDCNRSYIDRKNSNHLRSQGHIIIVMKKRCCSRKSTITQKNLCCSNHDLTCCISKLTKKTNDNTQLDFSDKQNHTRRKISFDISVRYLPKANKQTKKFLININTLVLIFC